LFTVSQLAGRCGLSRSTVLYYESLGLIKPASRSEANYRRYGERDLRRLEQIRAYRAAGLTLEDIAALLDGASPAAAILKKRFLEIDREIVTLRKHQQAILRLLQPPDNTNQQRSNKYKAMTKQKWTDIMRATGFTDDDMNRWHFEFERAAPEDHQQFLEFLHIQPDEIAHIREWSRNRGKK
jgi:MerR family transcriptional regulator, thiopeptide resistance regulator